MSESLLLSLVSARCHLSLWSVISSQILETGQRKQGRLRGRSQNLNVTVEFGPAGKAFGPLVTSQVLIY